MRTYFIYNSSSWTVYMYSSIPQTWYSESRNSWHSLPPEYRPEFGAMSYAWAAYSCRLSCPGRDGGQCWHVLHRDAIEMPCAASRCRSDALCRIEMISRCHVLLRDAMSCVEMPCAALGCHVPNWDVMRRIEMPCAACSDVKWRFIRIPAVVSCLFLLYLTIWQYLLLFKII